MDREEAEALGDPYLQWADAAGRERVLSLAADWDRVTVGRGMASDVALSWDANVSTVHATVERLSDEWVLVDEGLSRNGSFVNEQRVDGRRRLLHGDRLRFGDTTLRFFAPFQSGQETITAHLPEDLRDVRGAERRD